MQYVFALLLGVVQGITEFLPISSTGHLVILEQWLQLDAAVFNLSFDVMVHLGTLIAVVVYFRSLGVVDYNLYSSCSGNRICCKRLYRTIPKEYKRNCGRINNRSNYFYCCGTTI